MSKQHLGFVCLAIAVCCPAQTSQQKSIRTQAECDLYDAVVKDFGSGNFQKALADLDVWTQKFPDSEVRDARQYLFVQAYYSAKQPAKSLEAAEQLLSRDAEALLGNPADYARLLYAAATSITQIANPTAQQIATATQAARTLGAFSKVPAGTDPQAWAKTLTELKAGAHVALRHIALLAAVQALASKNCSAAETAARRAIETYPDSAQAAWYLGSAALCQYAAQPEKASLMLYEFARAAALDPVKGMADPQWQKSTVEPALVKYYAAYHGEDPEGLRELRGLAVQSPLPPEGFTVKSAAEIANEKRLRFETEHPELALWSRIKTALLAPDGDQYFVEQLKDAAVPPLRGVLIEARPDCRPKELVVAVPMPDATAPYTPEILLKLDKPIPGRLAAPVDLVFQGVPSSVTRNPFLLTFDVELAILSGPTPSPCTPAPVKKNSKR